MTTSTASVENQQDTTVATCPHCGLPQTFDGYCVESPSGGCIRFESQYLTAEQVGRLAGQ